METLSDIVAEMRRNGDAWCEDKSTNKTECLGLITLKYADRIEEAIRLDRVCRRAIEVPVRIVPTCGVARAQRRLELLRAQMQDMADNVESGNKVRFNPLAVVAEIDETLSTRPRNCDVFADALWGTISRAWQDWLLTPEFNKRKIGGMKEFCYWFLGPAKEGVAK